MLHLNSQLLLLLWDNKSAPIILFVQSILTNTILIISRKHNIKLYRNLYADKNEIKDLYLFIFYDFFF